MYRHNQRQLELEDFHLPFGGKLRSDNRWVKMAKFIPWEEFEPAYRKSFKRVRDVLNYLINFYAFGSWSLRVVIGERYFTQFSIFKFGIRLNSCSLLVTSVQPIESA